MSKEIGFKNRDRFIQLGITISVLRKMRGMSQEQLAAGLGTDPHYISSLENGKRGIGPDQFSETQKRILTHFCL